MQLELITENIPSLYVFVFISALAYILETDERMFELRKGTHAHRLNGHFPGKPGLAD